MRNRVFWNSPQTRLFSCLTLLGLMALVLAGCGGGGGGSNNNGGGGPKTTNVSITGTVKDNSNANAPVVDAVVTIVGTSLTTTTDAKGNYSFASVPITATAFTVARPVATGSNYFSYANFGGHTYDIINCTFPLPTLHTGTNTIGEVDLLVSSNTPPPVPVGGCP